MTARVLSPYEKNQLRRHLIDPEKIDEFGDLPVEYITGEVVFRQLPLTVTPAVLIPRVETEELVSLVQAELATHTDPHLHVAEVGTGSGAIILSLIHESAAVSQTITWLASDISLTALTVAQKNAERLIPYRPVQFILSDLLQNYPEGLKLDLLVANLPYIPASQLSTLDPSVKNFEPFLALDGGPLGLDLILRLLETAPGFLKPKGVIWLEIDETHTAQQLDPYHRYATTIYQDSFGKNRFARLQLLS